MLINNSINTQRSLTNSWAESPIGDFPSGVIVDLQFSLPDDLTDIFLTSMKVTKGVLNLIFRDSENQYLASVETKITGIPVALNGRDATVFGNILIGYIPVDGTYLTAAVKINPALVSVYSPPNTAIGTAVHIVSEGEDVLNEVIDENNLYLLAGYGITLDYDEEEVTVGAESEVIQDIRNSRYAGSTEKLLYTINNIRGDTEGDITLKLSVVGDAVTAKAVTTGIITLAAAETYMKPVDELDAALKKTPTRYQQYLPLDDCYTFDTAGQATQRDTLTQLNKPTTALIYSTPEDEAAFAPSYGTVFIEELNPAYDEIPEEVDNANKQ